MSSQNNYKYLEARPHPWRQQLCIKGRNMTVWHLVGTARAWEETPEEAARNRDLPLEAVLEAYDYYERNRELIESEVEEEGRRLREAGLLSD